MALIAPQARKIRCIISDFWFTVATQSSMLERYFDVGEVRVSMLEECFDVGEVRVSMLEDKFQHRNFKPLQHRNFNIEIQNFTSKVSMLEPFCQALDFT